MINKEQWNGFQGRKWKEEVDVRDFIQKNYEPYEGDSTFLADATDATDKLWGALQKLQKEDFIRSGTATEEMMDFLSFVVRYGASATVAGATSSGKTTLTGWLLTTIPDDKRIYTIENGSRELDLVKRDENGKIINKVIHTITRESEDERKCITQDNLLDMSLRFHPDYIVVGEMRSSEADSAQEAARTGHTVIPTIHSNSCEATWRRMVTLCKRKYPNVDDNVILNLVTEAFPIVVYAKQLENKSRRIMEIMECEIKPDGEREYHTLYRYKITENRISDGKFIIKGVTAGSVKG